MKLGNKTNKRDIANFREEHTRKMFNTNEAYAVWHMFNRINRRTVNVHNMTITWNQVSQNQ